MSRYRSSNRLSRFEQLENRLLLTTFVDTRWRVDAEFLADVDGDGDLDGVATSHWVENDGSGRFTTQHAFGASAGRLQVLGDVDGDGDLDALFAVSRDEGIELQVRLNEGQGRFAINAQTVGQPSQVSFDYRDAKLLADFDGDSFLDILTVEAEETSPEFPELQRASFRMWFNDGQGHFTRRGDSFGERTGQVCDVHALPVDLDRDGDMDFLHNDVSCDPFERASPELWLNDGEGGFRHVGPVLSDHDVREMALADLDRDMELDLLEFRSWPSQTSDVWLNDGNAGFSRGTSFRNDLPSTVGTVGDFDNDGDQDAIVGNQLWLNDGKANFSDSGQRFNFDDLVPPAATTRRLVGDLDADGDLDLVWGDKVLLNEQRTLAVWNGNAAVGDRGDDSSWADDSNWSLDGMPDVPPLTGWPGSDVIVTSDTDESVELELGEDRVVNSLVFTTDSTMSGQSLTFTYGELHIDEGVEVTINCDVNAIRKTGAGLLTLNGNVGAVRIEEGTLEGSGNLATLRVGRGATLSPGADAGTITADGNVEIEGTFYIDVGAKTDLLAVASVHAVVLGEASRLSISASESLASVGYHQPTIATAGFISRKFASVPEAGQHIGFGVFTAAGDDPRFSTTYHLRSLEISLFQAAAGDANGDSAFDLRDILQVLQAAKYLTGEAAAFDEGDWNGDGVFGQLDILAALETGNYLRGPYAADEVRAAIDQ